MASLSATIRSFLKEESIIHERELALGAVLGRGATGVTYAATLRGENVAVKVYDPLFLEKDCGAVEREISVLSRLKHPGVVQFRGVALSEAGTGECPLVALVTKLAALGDLERAMYRNEIVRIGGDPLRFRLCKGLARALKYAHEQGVVHRDLHPSNILLDDMNEPVLSDFGYSRYVDVAGRMTGETGSYEYMAPEVIRHEPYGEKADVFGFAVLVNELFEGKIPYKGLNPIDAAVKVACSGLRPDHRVLKREYKSVANLITQCWDNNPEIRPEWDEILEILSEAEALCTSRLRDGNRRRKGLCRGSSWLGI